tara:strand:- start:365 stop:1393 length:1029 start_codon:yes stop_codon:yes gene_type:complete
MSLKNLNVKIKIPKSYKIKLDNEKVKKIYQKFEKKLNLNQSFIVAVSGGPDSLALAFLAKVYSLKKNIKSKFYIVDHKIRIGSTKEAKLVKKILKQNLINAEILSSKFSNKSKNIQSEARQKRFKLLFAKCDEFNINNILMGHHQDDLIENFFIRMARGSGLKGLISLSEKSKFQDKNIFRPLLDHKKEDLIFLSKYIFNFFVKDPSNSDEKFKRVRIRNLLNELKKNGLNNKKLLHTIENLKHSDDVVSFYVNNNIKENSIFSSKSQSMILNQKFFDQSYEVIFRSLSDLIKIVGKKYYSVRGKKLDRIISNIKNNTLFRVTLGGCLIEKVNQTTIISKEH